MINILIADDHEIVREGLKQIVSGTDDMIVTGEASNGFDAVNMAVENNYDMVLLDISMPGKSGLEILEQLKQEKPGLPVLILSIYPEEQYAVRAFRSGASGYLTKESASEELIKAIHKVFQGGKYVSSSLAEKLAYELEDNSQKPLHETLSNREFEVLRMIGSGKDLRQIAETLLISAKTVSTYRARVLKKMNMTNNAELIRYVIEYKLEK